MTATLALAAAIFGAVVYTPEEISIATQKVLDQMPADIEREIYHHEPPINTVEDKIRAIRGMDPALRQKLIEFYRKAAYPLPGAVNGLHERSLYELGDMKVIEKHIRKYLQEGDDSYAGSLWEGGNPDIIALVAPYLSDHSKLPGSRISILPDLDTRRGTAAWILAELSPRCYTLKPELQRWLVKASNTRPWNVSADILETWWKENRVALEAHDYDKVRPAKIPDEAIPAVKPHSPDATATLRSPADSKPEPIPAVQKHSSRTKWFGWVCAIFAGLLIAFRVLKRSRRTSDE